MVDEAFLEKLRQFTVDNSGVDLAAPENKYETWAILVQLTPCSDHTTPIFAGPISTYVFMETRCGYIFA